MGRGVCDLSHFQDISNPLNLRSFHIFIFRRLFRSSCIFFGKIKKDPEKFRRSLIAPESFPGFPNLFFQLKTYLFQHHSWYWFPKIDLREPRKDLPGLRTLFRRDIPVFSGSGPIEYCPEPMIGGSGDLFWNGNQPSGGSARQNGGVSRRLRSPVDSKTERPRRPNPDPGRPDRPRNGTRLGPAGPGPAPLPRRA